MLHGTTTPTTSALVTDGFYLEKTNMGGGEGTGKKLGGGEGRPLYLAMILPLLVSTQPVTLKQFDWAAQCRHI